MSSDPNRKSPRTFQCRDMLWETFDQMARELECSVDYLINEAMKQYARQRSYGARTPYPGPSGAPPASDGRRAVGSVLPPPPRSRPKLGPPNAADRSHSGARPGLPVPPPAPMGGSRPSTLSSARTIPPPIPLASPRGPSAFPAPPPDMMASQGPLCVIYNGQKLPVVKDRFVIGRGKQSSDLTLKDPNVSRQHAMIEYQNGAYFLVDMGSTNGVEYNGQRVNRKQIYEGDLFRICDHELRFTFR